MASRRGRTNNPTKDALHLDARAGLPDALRLLLADYPRANWQADPNFGGLVAFWLDRHVNFRRLMAMMTEETEALIDRRQDPQVFGARLSRLGSHFLQDIHSHHTIEDTHFFPLLTAQERRLERGFAMLEEDHHALDAHLGAFTDAANGALTVDAGIGYLDNEPLGSRATIPLHEERYALVLRADDPLAARAQVAWADLGPLALCLLTPDMQNRRIIARHLAEAGVTAAPRVESNATAVLIAHVLAGGWATILPMGAAEPFLLYAPLRAVPLVEPDARHRVGLIAPAREPQAPLIAALMAEVRGLPR